MRITVTNAEPHKDSIAKVVALTANGDPAGGNALILKGGESGEMFVSAEMMFVVSELHAHVPEPEKPPVIKPTTRPFVNQPISKPVVSRPAFVSKLKKRR